MAQASQSLAGPAEAAALDTTDRSFLWRRLHSLTGLLPVGFFMCFHIFENLSAVKGPRAYDESIAKLADMLPVPYFYLVEIGVLAVPIAFHGLYGLYVTLDGRPNLKAYDYPRNYMWLMQRVTGALALAYLVYHVVVLRIGITMMHVGQGVPGHAGYVAFADMKAHYASPLVVVWYIVGTLSCAFHFANGLNGFAWTWGIAVGEKSRRAIEWVAWGVFFVAAIPMLHILWSFR